MTQTSRKAQLWARAEALTARLKEIEAALDEPVPQDWEDLAVERADDEVQEAIGLAGQQELRQITAALARIEEGSYGFCVTCGEAIAPGRLDLLPYTPFCAGCAR
ncbi:MAG: TraR/DksA family transcriptional regulator [Paracoccaceae bacterium]